MLNPFTFWLLSLAILGLAQPAMAYLGGFEEQDGYLNSGVNPLRDVSSYNAGQYGSNPIFGPNSIGPGGIFQNITPNTGLFFKNDVGDIAEHNGELVAHQNFARTGTSGLVLRSSLAFGDTGGDGADYTYAFDNRDFNGSTPSQITSGTLDIDYWMCPQAAPFASGTLTTTEFLNSNGDTIFAVGTVGQGAFTTDPLIEWFDAGGWHSTGVLGNHISWDHVMLSFDLTNDLVSFSFYSSLDLQIYNFAVNVGAANPIDSLAGIRFTAQPNTEKNSYDDFSTSAPVVIPEPSGFLLAILGAMPVVAFRRRRDK